MKAITVIVTASILLALCNIAQSEVEVLNEIDCGNSCRDCQSCTNSCECYSYHRICTQGCNKCRNRCRPRPTAAPPLTTVTTGHSEKQTNVDSDKPTHNNEQNQMNTTFDITSGVSNNNTIHMPVEYNFNHHTNITVIPSGAPHVTINVSIGGVPKQTELNPHPIGEEKNCCQIIDPSSCLDAKQTNCTTIKTFCGSACLLLPNGKSHNTIYITKPIYVPHSYLVKQPYVAYQRVRVPEPYPVYQKNVPQPYLVESQVPVPQPYPVMQKVPQLYAVEKQIPVPQPYPVIPRAPYQMPCLFNGLQEQTIRCSPPVGQTSTDQWTNSGQTSTCSGLSQYNPWFRCNAQNGQIGLTSYVGQIGIQGA